ncbi:MAG: hypothetical protein EOM59_14330 [Clostridia bacterium]|nr:hypothetical protein [Clostridia bacterium]
MRNQVITSALDTHRDTTTVRQRFVRDFAPIATVTATKGAACAGINTFAKRKEETNPIAHLHRCGAHTKIIR